MYGLTDARLGPFPSTRLYLEANVPMLLPDRWLSQQGEVNGSEGVKLS